MSGKRDEDSQGDMEVGMTTAERRRRRRRGAGLRVPSDNVPRSRTPTAPPPPVPEDPALAMSIAYSFKNDASGPVPRPRGTDPAATDPQLPIAPADSPTVIDPPVNVESQDFEMKTREMSAVDLEALGLSNDGTMTMPFQRLSSPGLSSPRLDKTLEVDVDIENEPTEFIEKRAIEAKAEPKKVPGGRHPTVALSEEDLEEVRAAMEPTIVRPQSTSQPPATRPQSTSQPPATQRPQSTSQPPATQPKKLDTNSTMPLSALDVEALTKSDEEPVSVAEIDVQELAERAESSGEIEVDVDTDDDEDIAAAKKPEEPIASRTTTPMQASPSPAASQPLPKTTMPPANAPATQKPPTPPAKPPVPPDRKSGVIDASHAQPAPPKPPAPPQKKPLPQAAVTAAIKKEPSKPTNRARPWFVDLFDEDYLRTLPFLTPQATQSEAEFVVNSMNLAPGAQVLDLGCGYGRHAMELAARGFHVVGLDLSTPLLVRGGEEAHRRGLTINFVRGDMRELDFEGQFDGAYCLFSTFGYFDDETNKKTLQNVCRALKGGGKVCVEILNRDYVIADLPTRVWWEGDGCVVLEEVELNYFSSRIQVNRSVVFDDGRQLEQEISVRAYSLHEVGKLMHAAGFRVLEVSGGYQTRGRFFGNQSRHIIVLAERKETSGT